MFQSLIRSLRQKELLTPAVIILSLLVVLSLIIILGQFFHQSLQEEMAGQFNKQQLLLAREVAMNIEGFIAHAYKDIQMMSRLPDIHQIDRISRSRTMADAVNFNIQNAMLVTIRVLNKDGIVLYDSSYPGREGVDLSKTDYFQKARLLPRNEKLVTDLLPESDGNTKSRQFIVATAIYPRRREQVRPEFRGVVLAVLSLDGITQKFLSPIKSGTSGYAWMMDSDGTLLYHPTQPEMVGKNLYRTDLSCFQCHKSFDAEKKMIEGKTEIYGYYRAPGGEDKLAAFYKFPLARKSWVVVVSAPYSDVIALMRKSKGF